MLPSLRLLHGIPCPDHQPPQSSCLRQPCLFSHTLPRPVSTFTSTSTSTSTSATATAVGHRLASREGQLKSSLLKQRQVTRPPPPPASSIAPLPSARPSRPSIAPTPSGSSSRSKHSTSIASSSVGALAPDAPLSPPRIQVNKATTSHTPIAVRQKLLDTLYAAFLSLYAALPQRVQLGAAHRDALRQEAECMKTTSRLTYRNAIISMVARLRKRAPAPSGREGELYFTGTLAEFDERQVALAKLTSGVQTAWMEPIRFEKFLLTPEKMVELDYVVEPPENENEEESGIRADASGTEQMCERCRMPFGVSKIRLPGDEEECSFHWGKPMFERIDGVKQKIFTCCNSTESDSKPCTKGRHVFLDKSVERLHTRAPFVRLPPLGSQPTIPIVALDCELVYTTAGMWLARLTIVVPVSSSDGGTVFETLLDEFVRLPRSVSVLDLNTRFSGIQSESELESARFDLGGIQEEMARLGVDSGTVICGHGLENDLKALRLVHDRCIDTVDLFPHPRVLPMRMSLKKLSSIFLNKLVQNSDPGLGHDSLEDATIALELIKYKIEHDENV
ncbi:hypothetical protein CROQUDRAFT_655733 [Cronartium quercuum f. sp. fusiforme G11]|uniref:Exonuclease domain-containing protein n=1 Tax=Cronartium quercuum f. sp. fusiforme G11 TaxID=708437 RepID=A0A9P6TCU2_9BASI|nr:hypothetical protein CROQUDRAFT_655733 [Cronartium quercuum f. sp. fusiforme G11]